MRHSKEPYSGMSVSSTQAKAEAWLAKQREKDETYAAYLNCASDCQALEQEFFQAVWPGYVGQKVRLHDLEQRRLFYGVLVDVPNVHEVVVSVDGQRYTLRDTQSSRCGPSYPLPHFEIRRLDDDGELLEPWQWRYRSDPRFRRFCQRRYQIRWELPWSRDAEAFRAADEDAEADEEEENVFYEHVSE